MPVQIRTIANGESSAIGNGILNNIEGDDNVMVITDGANNEGKLLVISCFCFKHKLQRKHS